MNEVATLSEVLTSVQFLTAGGRRLAVLDADEWEGLVEWLEAIEDIQIAQRALEQLRTAGGDPETAGWLRWEDVQHEL
jgi:hypothetical protein